MKHLILLFSFLLFASSLSAADKFIDKEGNLPASQIEQPTSQQVSSPTPTPPEGDKKNAPGKMSSFWFTFLMAAVGTALLWGAFLGPLAVLIVYFSSGKLKVEVKKSLWGWLAGLAIGVLVLILRFVVLQ